MSEVIWTGLISIAVMTFYLGWFEKEPTRKIINYASSLVFWIGTAIVWTQDNSQDMTLTWIYVLPITTCLFMLYQSATEYLEAGFTGYKNDPWQS